MSALYIALPASMLLAAAGLAAFVWMVRSGQMDDVDTPPARMLLDDEDEPVEAHGVIGRSTAGEPIDSPRDSGIRPPC